MQGENLLFTQKDRKEPLKIECSTESTEEGIGQDGQDNFSSKH